MLIRSISSAGIDRNYQKKNIANNTKLNNASSSNVTFGLQQYNGYKFPSGIYYYGDIYTAKLEMALHDIDVKKWREVIMRNELLSRYSAKDYCFSKKPEQYLDQIEKLIADLKQNIQPEPVKLNSHSEFTTSKFL